MSGLSFADLLARSQKVHEFYKADSKTWGPFEQIAHVHAEVSEVWDALRNKNQKYGVLMSPEWKAHLLDEIADVVISGLTTALDLKFDHAEIEAALERTLQKIEKRTWNK